MKKKRILLLMIFTLYGLLAFGQNDSTANGGGAFDVTWPDVFDLVDLLLVWGIGVTVGRWRQILQFLADILPFLRNLVNDKDKNAILNIEAVRTARLKKMSKPIDLEVIVKGTGKAAMAIVFFMAMSFVAIAQTFTISSGGTYSGEWVNNNPDLPAVNIATSEVVVIENSRIESKGDLISLSANNANVTVINTIGRGVNPNVYGQTPGRFFISNSGKSPRRIIIENCDLLGTSGIFIRDMNGGTIKVRYNFAEHIDGRASDGSGDWIDAKTLPDFVRKTRQFIMLRKCVSMKETEIAWNKVVNVKNGQALPMQEDIFNFNAGGIISDSLRVHHNIAIGAYSFDPSSKQKYSGGGFIGDGDDCKYLVFHHNYAIGLMNYNFSVATGGAIVFRHNVAIGSAILPGGEELSGYNKVGLSHQLNNSPNSKFFGNRVAYMNTGDAWIDIVRKDWNFKNCKNGNCEGNISIPVEEVTPELEQKYIDEYDSLAVSNGITFGAGDSVISPPNPSDPNPDPNYVTIPLDEYEGLIRENATLTTEVGRLEGELEIMQIRLESALKNNILLREQVVELEGKLNTVKAVVCD